MLIEIIERCRQRQAEGDRPTVKAFSVEQLEDAVIELADKLIEYEGPPLGVCQNCGKKISKQCNQCATCADERGP